MTIRKELAKGSTAMLVLSVLEHENMYGYQIIKELERRSEEIFSLKEGTLYPILHGLEKEGFLDSYWEDTKSARSRKYYRMTESGRKELQSRKKEWELFTDAVNRVVTSPD